MKSKFSFLVLFILTIALNNKTLLALTAKQTKCMNAVLSYLDRTKDEEVERPSKREPIFIPSKVSDNSVILDIMEKISEGDAKVQALLVTLRNDTHTQSDFLGFLKALVSMNIRGRQILWATLSLNIINPIENRKFIKAALNRDPDLIDDINDHTIAYAFAVYQEQRRNGEVDLDKIFLERACLAGAFYSNGQNPDGAEYYKPSQFTEEDLKLHRFR